MTASCVFFRLDLYSCNFICLKMAFIYLFAFFFFFTYNHFLKVINVVIFPYFEMNLNIFSGYFVGGGEFFLDITQWPHQNMSLFCIVLKMSVFKIVNTGLHYMAQINKMRKHRAENAVVTPKMAVNTL